MCYHSISQVGICILFFSKMQCQNLFVCVLEGVKYVTASVYVLLALVTGSWLRSDVGTMLKSSYPECTSPQVMRLGGQGQGICSESVERNIKHKKDGIIGR